MVRGAVVFSASGVGSGGGFLGSELMFLGLDLFLVCLGFFEVLGPLLLVFVGLGLL